MVIFRLLISIILVVFLSVPLVSAETNIIAKVDVVPITKFELDREIDRILPFRVNYHGKVSDDRKTEIRDEALQDLIERAYKIRYALSKNIEISEKEIEERVNNAKKKFKNEKEFQAAIGDESIEEIKNSIRRSMLANEAEKLAVTDKIKVSEKDVSNFYEQNKNIYLYPKQFRASHILIKVDPAATKKVHDELYEKAKQLLIKAKAGEDFYNLAYYNSDDKNKFVGGDLGYFHVGQAEKPIEEALLKLKVGEISDVIESLHGYHILKLTDTKPERQLTFDEVNGKIRDLLEKKQRDALYETWMENLKATYKVERFDS